MYNNNYLMCGFYVVSAQFWRDMYGTKQVPTNYLPIEWLWASVECFWVFGNCFCHTGMHKKYKIRPFTETAFVCVCICAAELRVADAASNLPCLPTGWFATPKITLQQFECVHDCYNEVMSKHCGYQQEYGANRFIRDTPERVAR